MEKLKQTFALTDIKEAFADPARLNRSFVSKQGADDLGMDDAEVVAVIQALTLADFDKSMTSIADHKVWQDVAVERFMSSSRLMRAARCF